MLANLVYILIIAIVVGIIWWVCDYLPVPEPLNKLVKILSIVVAVIAIIYVLLAMAGMVSGVNVITSP